MTSVNVFTTNEADLVIPDIVYDRAKELSANPSDKRTKGYKLLSSWAHSSDFSKKIMERSLEIRKDVEKSLLLAPLKDRS